MKVVKEEIKLHKIRYRLRDIKKKESTKMTKTSRVMIAKLNNDNYESWTYKVELLLVKEGL